MATEIEKELEKSAVEEAKEVEEKEKKIPVFTVLKNNSILKNIFLIDTPPDSLLPTAASSSSTTWMIPKDEKQEEGLLEEILVVGRHPDCNITVEHPSISRFHLRIHSIPSLESLSVIDLSSGTYFYCSLIVFAFSFLGPIFIFSYTSFIWVFRNLVIDILVPDYLF